MTTGELRQIEGENASIDLEKRFFTLQDRQGIILAKIIYGPQFDQKMAKQKIGYYEKVPAEVGDEDDTAVLQDLQYVERPKDWPRRNAGQRKGTNWQPRNDRAIMLQVCYKCCCDLAKHHMLDLSESLDEKEMDRVMDWAVARAKRDAAELMKEAGG